MTFTLYESQMTGERVTVDTPLTELRDIEEIRADLGLASWVDLEDLPMRKAAALLWASRRAGLSAKVFGGSAFRLLSPSSNAGPLRRELNDVDYVLPAGAGPRFLELAASLADSLGTLHMHFLVNEDARFNSLSAGKRYRMRMVVRGAGETVEVKLVDVFAESFNFCHRIDLKGVVKDDALTLGLPLLVLTKCQFIKALPRDVVGAEDAYRALTAIGDKRVAIGMEDKDLLDVAAGFLDHEVDADAVVERTAADWGLARTVLLNLRNADGARHVLGRRGLAADSIERVTERMGALADRVEERVPRKPRLRLRTTWWEEVEDS